MVVALALSLLVLAAPPAPAATAPLPAPWDLSFSPDTAAMLAASNAFDPPKKSEAEMLLQDVRVEIDGEGRSTLIRRTVVRVVSHGAIEHWGTSSAYWAPWYESRPEIRARVITPDGVAHELDATTIAEGPASQDPMLLDDRRVLHAPLPAVSVGSIIEVQTVTRDTAPFFDAGVVARESLVSWTPGRRLRVTLDFADASGVRWEVRGGGGQPSRRSEKGRTTLVWEAGPFEKRPRWDANVSPDVARAPEISWATGKSWNAVAARYAAIVEQQIGGAPPLVTPVPRGKTRDIARILLAALQSRVRYTGLEFGNSSIVPATPARSLERGFGDCKDKASALVAALRASGVDAHVALLSTGPGENVSEALPGMGLFNHAIVYVGGGDPFWIDPTVESAEPGILPAADSNRLALVASPKTKSLLRTPPVTSAANLHRYDDRIELPSYGLAKIHAENEVLGPAAVSARSRALHTPKDLRIQQWVKWAKASYQTKETPVVTLPDPVDPSARFISTIDVRRSANGSAGETELWAIVSPTRAFEELPWGLQKPPKKKTEKSSADDAEDGDDEDDGGQYGSWRNDDKTPRTLPWHLDEPYSADVRTVVILPPGCVVRDPPQNESKRVGTAMWSATYALAGTSFTASFHFDTGAGPFSIEEAGKLGELVDSVRKRRSFVRFDRAAMVALAEGRVVEAVHALRALADARPSEGEPHVFLARAYMAAGLAEEARREATRAVQLAPSSEYCAMSLGLLYEYDAFGRPYAAGSDFVAAERWLRVAVGLGDGDDALPMLAMTLEFSPGGKWWGDGARIEEAVADFEKLHDKKSRKLNNVQFYGALLRAGKYDRLRELLGPGRLAPTDEAILLAATALEKGGAEASAILSRSDNAESRDVVRGQCIQLLLQLRRYPEAALLAKDFRKKEAAGTAVDFAELLARTHRHEDLRLDPKKPEDVVRLAIMNALGVSGVAPEALYVPEAIEQAKADAIAMRKASGSLVGGNAGVLAFNPDLAVDFALAYFDLKVDAGGSAWRVHFVPFGGGPAMSDDNWVFLRKTPAGPRILADDEALELLALQALDALDAKDSVTARRWLDWANDADRAPELSTFKGTPFAHFWARTGASAPTADAMRVAAAAIAAAGEDTSVRAIPILEAALGAATDRDRVQVQRALLMAYEKASRREDVLSVVRTLEERFPDENILFSIEVAKLRDLGRFDEAEKLARARIADRGEDVAASQLLAATLEAKGDFAGADALHRRFIEQGKLISWSSNMIAWNSLFGASPIADAEKIAERAVETGHSASAAELHTLACVEAELGKLSEAHEHLLQAEKARGDLEPAPEDWYVIGRIAEQLDLRQFATESYAKVPKKESPDSTWALAQRRLHAMSSVSR